MNQTVTPAPTVLTPPAIVELVKTHAAKRLQLATSVGLEGYVHINGDRQAAVTELLRLAFIGAWAEHSVADGANVRTVALLGHSAKAWSEIL